MNDTQRDSATMIGALLGSYRLDSELGSGGMGTVYRATHQVLGRSAAIKLLRGDLITSPELVTRFLNEAKAASAIRHPGIVEVFDFGHTSDGRAFLVMEFLDGESLAGRIEKRGHLPANEAAQIARGIASALTAAHRSGIVHRDLKPDNVFLVPDPELGERPKLLDFGIAKLADLTTDVRHTQTGALMGTPLYMAPEQARAAKEIDHRADLYSLGCILYEMLVGAPPFVADGAGEIIAMHLFGKVDKPSAHAPGIPPELDAIVLRLLEKEPAARFQNAAEVGSELEHTGATAAVTTPMARQRRVKQAPIAVPTIDERPRRSALPIVAAVLTLVLAAVGTGLFFWLRDRGEPAAVAAPPAEPKLPPAPVPAPKPAAVTNQPPPPVEPVKQPTTKKKGPTTKKGSPIENGID